MEIGYSARRKEMFHTQTDNVFGICQLGEWDTLITIMLKATTKELLIFQNLSHYGSRYYKNLVIYLLYQSLQRQKTLLMLLI